MPRLPVTDLRPGHVTAAPVTSATGVVLVQPGTALTAALVLRLQALGIESVAVGAGALSPEVRAQRLAEIEARFAGHEQNAWMSALRAVVVRLQAGEEAPDPHA